MNVLKQHRESKFLSIRELSEKSGVSASTITELEQERTAPQPRTIRKLAEALDIEPGKLADLRKVPA